MTQTRDGKPAKNNAVSIVLKVHRMCLWDLVRYTPFEGTWRWHDWIMYSWRAQMVVSGNALIKTTLEKGELRIQYHNSKDSEEWVIVEAEVASELLATAISEILIPRGTVQVLMADNLE